MNDYHHGNLREALVRTGDDELKRVGPDALSLREITRQIGVSHNAPYRHFPDKSALIAEIVARAFEEMADKIIEAEVLYPDFPAQQIESVGRHFGLLAIRHPRKAELMFSGGPAFAASPAQTTRMQAAHEMVIQSIQSLLERGALSGQLNVANPNQFAIQIFASFQGLANLITAKRLKLAEEGEIFDLFDQTAENLLKIIRT